MPVVFRNISKSFGEHKVLTDVSFEVGSVRTGEIVALMGENGAGKSTLMRILAGVYPAGSYSGELLIDGAQARFAGVRDGKAAGIAMIHQELGLFPELTVAENLLLEEIRERHPFRIRWSEVFATAQAYLDELKFNVNARAKVGELRTGAAQLVEIARALRTDAHVLIMDEPTSALTEPEVERLFEILATLRAKGKSVFYVSHRMEEISRVADRVVVLRDGVIAGIDEAKNLDRDKIIKWMVGRDVSSIYPTQARPPRGEKPLLKVEHLTLRDTVTEKTLVRDASFEVHGGEIVGLAGLMGAGRSELALAVFGAFGRRSPHHDRYEVSGIVQLDGARVDWRAPADAQAARVALLTEDRKGSGLLLNRPAAENMVLTVLRKLARPGPGAVLDRKREREVVKRLAGELSIRGPGLHAEVGVYSGGNQQKVALAKCLALEPRLLILDEPTRGVDIGAKLEIYAMMVELTKKGVAILLISSELPELLGLSDRVVVLRHGEIAGSFDEKPFDPEKVMHAASL